MLPGNTWPKAAVRSAAALMALLAVVQVWRSLPPGKHPLPPDPVLSCRKLVQVQPGDLLVCADSDVPLPPGLSRCCIEALPRARPGDRITCKQRSRRCRVTIGRMSPDLLSLLKIRLNPNTACSRDLESLPGIGPGLARDIVEYRRRHGAFPTVRAMLEVPGIGPKVLARIRGRLSISR